MSHVFQEIIKVKVSSECMVKMPWNENERGKESKKRDNIAAGIYRAVISSVPDEVREVNAMFICLFAHLHDMCILGSHTRIAVCSCVCVLSVSVIYSSTLKIKSRVDSMKRITSNKNTHKYISHIYYSAKDGSSPKNKLVWRFSVCSLLILCIQIIWFHFALIPP